MKFQVVISKSRIFETFLYCVVTSYSLSIEKCLFDKHFVASTNYTDFYWYSKCGGGNSGLKFIFRLKYDKGHIFVDRTLSIAAWLRQNGCLTRTGIVKILIVVEVRLFQ